MLSIYTDVSEEENSRLYDLLSQKGLNITLEIWDDPAVDWSKYDVVVLKSPWDYFDKITAFYAWLDKLEQLGVRVLNPTSIVRWNTDKRYLIELQEKGVSVVPSLWLEQGAALNVDELFEKLQADKVILKPAISGGAKNTFALTQAEAQEQAASINNLLQQESFWLSRLCRRCRPMANGRSCSLTVSIAIRYLKQPRPAISGCSISLAAQCTHQNHRPTSCKPLTI
ncbi:hypothetical protein GCM10028895_42700 [Pontibacter rugosus]